MNVLIFGAASVPVYEDDPQNYDKKNKEFETYNIQKSSRVPSLKSDALNM